MQLKPTAAIGVLLLVSLLIAGFTTSTTNQTPSASAATRNAFLEDYLAEYKNVRYASSSMNMAAWELTRINSTSARVEHTTLNKTENGAWNYVDTIILFRTAQDATNYLNAMNKIAYSLASTEYLRWSAIRMLTGHAPQFTKNRCGTRGIRLISQITSFTLSLNS